MSNNEEILPTLNMVEVVEENLVNETTAEIPVEWVWERLRLKRDALLKKCDYRIVADAPWDIQPWLDYRQALRDLPKTAQDPKKIVFPNPPA
jgi:hypothetical protein